MKRLGAMLLCIIFLLTACGSVLEDNNMESSPSETVTDKELLDESQLFQNTLHTLSKEYILRVEVVWNGDVTKSSTDRELISRWITYLQSLTVKAQPREEYVGLDVAVTFYSSTRIYDLGHFVMPYIYTENSRIFLHVENYEEDIFHTLLEDTRS